MDLVESTKGGAFPASGSGHSASPEPKVSALRANVPNAGSFTNADFLRVVTQLSTVLSRKAAELGYGAWNPDFCSADAAHEAAYFFEAIGHEANDW